LIIKLLSIINILKRADEENPNSQIELYNLAAQSHVQVSCQVEKYTAEVDGIGVLYVLQAIKILKLENRVRFYQASTSELFGNTLNTHKLTILNEDSPMEPISPYAIAKLYAYHLVKYYRQAYNIFCVNGILFNHTSPRRGHNFVCKKICDYVKTYKEHHYKTPIDLDILTENPDDITPLQLGNLNATRDFGHSKDYVKGMWMILQRETPDDYVLATQHRVTIREFVNMAFKQRGNEIKWVGEGINEKGYLDGKVVVEVSPKYFRPYDLTDLIGSSKKVREEKVNTLSHLVRKS
jgi:GDPmannose 4,6-dehydratase